MAERCQSWRYHPHAKHPVPPLPGGCRQCWSACKKLAPEGSKRCDVCSELLITNPNSEIRRAIALEPAVSDRTLARLSEDPVYSVALSATNVIEQRRRASESIFALRTPAPARPAPAEPTSDNTSALPWALR